VVRGELKKREKTNKRAYKCFIHDVPSHIPLTHTHTHTSPHNDQCLNKCFAISLVLTKRFTTAAAAATTITTTIIITTSVMRRAMARERATGRCSASGMERESQLETHAIINRGQP
jgi:hypothetical protein